MTIDQLRSYRRKSRELKQEKARYNGMIFDSKKPDISGARSGTSDTVSRVVIRREKKLAEIKALETELKKIREYISRCNNYYREPIFMHYVEGRSWVQIATQFSYNSADALRMSCKRYVASHPNL